MNFKSYTWLYLAIAFTTSSIHPLTLPTLPNLPTKVVAGASALFAAVKLCQLHRTEQTMTSIDTYTNDLSATNTYARFQEKYNFLGIKDIKIGVRTSPTPNSYEAGLNHIRISSYDLQAFSEWSNQFNMRILPCVARIKNKSVLKQTLFNCIALPAAYHVVTKLQTYLDQRYLNPKYSLVSTGLKVIATIFAYRFLNQACNNILKKQEFKYIANTNEQVQKKQPASK